MNGLVTPQFTVFKAPSFTTTPATGTAGNKYLLSLNCNNTNYLPKLNPLQLELPNYPINTVNLSSKIEFEMIENSISVDQSMERPDGNTRLQFLIDNADPEANGRFANYESVFNQYTAYNFTQMFKFNEEDVSDNTHLYAENIQYSANLKEEGMPENDQYPYYCYILNSRVDDIENYTIIRDFPIFNIDLLQNQDIDRFFGFLSEEGAPIYNQHIVSTEELEAFNYSRGLNNDLVLKSDTGDTNYTLLGFVIRRDKLNDDMYANTLTLVLKTPFSEEPSIPPKEFKIKCTEIQYMLSSNESSFNSEIYFETNGVFPSDDGQYKYICYSTDLGQYPSTSYKGWMLGNDDISILYDEKGICHWRYFTVQKVQKKNSVNIHYDLENSSITFTDGNVTDILPVKISGAEDVSVDMPADNSPLEFTSGPFTLEFDDTAETPVTGTHWNLTRWNNIMPGEISCGIIDNDGDRIISSCTNEKASDGKVVINASQIVFTKSGDYTYKLDIDANLTSLLTYDPSIITVNYSDEQVFMHPSGYQLPFTLIFVSGSEDNKLTVDAVRYPTSVVLSFTFAMNSGVPFPEEYADSYGGWLIRDLADGKYTFKLIDENGDAIAVATNTAEGLVQFDTIELEHPMNITYTIEFGMSQYITDYMYPKPPPEPGQP